MEYWQARTASSADYSLSRDRGSGLQGGPRVPASRDWTGAWRQRLSVGEADPRARRLIERRAPDRGRLSSDREGRIDSASRGGAGPDDDLIGVEPASRPSGQRRSVAEPPAQSGGGAGDPASRCGCQLDWLGPGCTPTIAARAVLLAGHGGELPGKRKSPRDCGRAQRVAELERACDPEPARVLRRGSSASCARREMSIDFSPMGGRDPEGTMSLHRRTGHRAAAASGKEARWFCLSALCTGLTARPSRSRRPDPR